MTKPSPPPPAREQMTHWRSVHRRANVDFLFAEDIGPVGTSIDVEIEASGVGELKDRGKSKRMPWLRFVGAKKKLGLNAGNCKMMETIAGGPVVEKWRGWITLVVIRTTYTDSDTKQRIGTDAVRIAPERPRNPRKGRYINELPPPAPEEISDDGAEHETTDAFGASMSDAERAEIERNEAARHAREDA